MTVSNGLKYSKPVHYVKCMLATIFSEGASSFTLINKSFTSLHELQDVILIFQGHAIHCTNSSPTQTGSLQLSAVGGEMEKQNIMMVWLLSVLALLQSQGELSQLQSVLGLLGSSSSRELKKHGSPPTSSTQLCTGGPWTLFKAMRPVFHSQVLHLKGWGCCILNSSAWTSRL